MVREFHNSVPDEWGHVARCPTAVVRWKGAIVRADILPGNIKAITVALRWRAVAGVSWVATLIVLY